MDSRKRYVIVGAGGRATSYLMAIAGPFAASSRLVGLCDPSTVRMRVHNHHLAERYRLPPVATYHPRDFERMVREQKADGVVVTSVDGTHHRYIIKALELGCEVVTEKPMTTTGPHVRAILAAAAAAKPGALRVAFNYRWQPDRTKVKELLVRGAIGRVRSVALEYLLDTSHGADYFRRWHSEMKHSGGLLVHKATHHFDLANWWLDAIPEQVFAHGDLVFYGRENAVRRGDEALTRYPRYTGVPEAKDDPFALDLATNDTLRKFYLEAEAESGYVRDRNVFRDGIDIYDRMEALVRYRTGEVLNYSLVAFSPREGMRIVFNGDRGRLEYAEFSGSHIIRGAADDATAEPAAAEERYIRVFPHFRPPYAVEVAPKRGGHGGADALLWEQIFAARPPADPWHRRAGPEQGAMSVLIGAAANRSIVNGRPVRIDTLASIRPDARALSELS